MKKIIYLKKVNNYDDVLAKEHKKMPLIIKKVVFLFKYIFNVVTKRNVDGYNIWVLPVKEQKTTNKIKVILKKMSLNNKDNIYVIPENLNSINKIMLECKLEYLNGEKLKKLLSIKILEYICALKNNSLNNIEVTLLVNSVCDINMYLIEEISKKVKTTKIVSLNIYKFRKLEEKLYNEFGIALQFSNSYRKSLANSKIIINLDFNSIDINEYDLFNNGIIINCSSKNVNIKSKLFNGVVVNSCNIKFKKDIQEQFKKCNIFSEYSSILLYESILNLNNLEYSINKIKEDKVYITNLIGNNGIINKKELKSIDRF